MTEEQQKVIDTVLSSKSDNMVVSVNACAGSGKTYTALNILKYLEPDTAFYTAFNKAIVEEIKEKINKFQYAGIEANTIHSLAYRHCKHKKIEPLNFSFFPKNIKYSEKMKALDLFKKYCLSKYSSFKDFMEKEYPLVDDVLRPPEVSIDVIYGIINKIETGEISTTFDYMLKQLQNKMIKGEVFIKTDCLILDECQDTPEVTLEIFKMIHAKKKIILGDTYQNIYGFMDTINAFKLLDNTIDLKLTKSFRCSPKIAETVQKFVRKYMNKDYVFTGTATEDIDDTIVYLFRNNSNLVSDLIDIIIAKEPFNTVRNPSELLETALALEQVIEEGKTEIKKYKFIENEAHRFRLNSSKKRNYEYFFQHILEKYCGSEIAAGVDLYKKIVKSPLNIQQIIEIINQNNENKHKKIFSTVHTFKGLEANTAIINDSLNGSIQKALNKKVTLKKKDPNTKIPNEIEEEFNIYYTALTRAKNNIIGEEF